MPKAWLPNTKLESKKPGVRFVAAQGTELEYLGRKMAKFRPVQRVQGKEVVGNVGQLEFHVTDATKALASAAAVTKAGNTVVLKRGGGYIQNDRTGERIELQERGGTFVFEVEWEDVGGEGSSFARLE